MPQDEPDQHNFSTSPDHRLPPINGVVALQNELHRARGISTGLQGLDRCLSPHNSLVAGSGIRRGYVTEVYGPPGSGKTIFGIQIALSATPEFGQALWISAGSPLMRSRVQDVQNKHVAPLQCSNELDSSPPDKTQAERELTENFIYHEVHSLPHLLVMLMHPTAIFPPPDTTVIVLDGLSSMFTSAFPRQAHRNDNKPSILQETAAKAAAGKRIQLIENLAGALSRLASSRHIAVVVLNKTATSMKSGQRAVLKPAIGGQAWDATVNTRIVLYRDFYPRHLHKRLTVRERRRYRLAEVVRLGAKDVAREPIPFVIERHGLRELVPDREANDLPIAHAEDLPAYEDPLRLRSNPADTRTPVPFISQDIFPTASQVLQHQGGEQGNAMPISVPLNLPSDKALVWSRDKNQVHPQARSVKRKATEIADSEDEEVDENQGEPGGTNGEAAVLSP
jgi:RecA/RadA recombinase